MPTISLVQTASGRGGGYVNSYGVTFGSSVTTANTIIVTVTAGISDTIDSISDNQGNTYLLAKEQAAYSDRKAHVYYGYNVTGGSVTVTVTFGSGQFVDSATVIREYSGLGTSDPLDVTAGNGPLSYQKAHTSTATGNTVLGEKLVIGAIGGNKSSPGYSAGTGYGNLATQAGFDAYTSTAVEDMITGEVGPMTATFDTTSFIRSATICVVFKTTTPIKNVQTGEFTASGNTDVSYNAGSGDDRMLVVVTGADDATDRVTVATYNGVSLTLVDREIRDVVTTEIWYLANPASGSNTLRLTTNNGDDYIYTAFYIEGYDDVDAFNSNNGDSASPSVALTTTVDNTLVIGGMVSDSSSDNGIPGSGQFEIVDTAWHLDHLVVNYIVKETAGSQTINSVLTDSDDWVAVGVAFSPVVAGTEYTKELTDSVIVTGLDVFSISRAITNQLSVSDSITSVNIFARTYSQIVDIGEQLVKSGTRVLVDGLNLSANAILSSARVLDDPVVISEIFAPLKSLVRTISEGVVIAGSLLGSISRTFTNSVIVTESLVTVKSIIKLLTETIAVADSLIRSIFLQLLQSVFVADSVLRATQRQLSESVVVSFLTERVKTFNTTITQTVAVSESLIKSIALIVIDSCYLAASTLFSSARTFVNSVSISDVVVSLFAKAFSESVNVTSAILRTSGKVVLNAIAVATEFVRSTSRAFSNSFNVVDTVTITTLYSTVLNEAIATIDSLVKAVQHTLSDSIIVSDVLEKIKSLLQIFTESIGVVDSSLRSAARSFGESVVTSDSFVSASVFVQQLTEAVAVAGSFIRTITRNFFESSIVQDAITYAQSSLSTFVEGVVVVGSSIKSVATTITHAVNVVDVRSIIKSLQATLSETVSAAANFLTTFQLGVSFTETVSAVGSFVRSTAKTFAQNLHVGGVLQSVNVFLYQIVNSITVSDSLTKTISATFQNVISAVDSFLSSGFGGKTYLTAKKFVTSLTSRMGGTRLGSGNKDGVELDQKDNKTVL